MEKTGKIANKYFKITSEKQELYNLLMNFVPSSKKNSKEKEKDKNEIEIKEQNSKDKANTKKETSKEKYIKKNTMEAKKVDNIEIIPIRQKSNDSKIKKQYK